MTLRLLVVLLAAHAALLTGMKVFDTHGSSQQMCAQKVLDDLDDTKDLSFAMIQDACVRQFRRCPDDDLRDYPDTQRSNKGHQDVVRTALNKEFPRAQAW